ncbi:TetR/AcrR family transcriptional regulator [Herbiconiux sp. L3-i23]|uniref:TetR/AcrR family transcriptional regulator n=1 Tax=Herbiconiux sp. L3-i23 TaxID=2905871 RepID=UPI002069EAAC|nr:TetR/AcrR family transcriptional regulator [Herbiconiux sp. L3-i23]BDI22334.1 TetR family transcriptional regulator [Herbiconiux sp. L3-i23]
MGLRAMKVARTREQIVSIALDLFIEQGYDETTMEQIAEKAEIGNSTLYRYFPSKDLLILDRFTQSFEFGRLLRERPETEPLEVSLGEVVRESLRASTLDDERFAELRRLVDNAPGPRAKLWDLVASSTRDLEDALAERLDRSPGDLLVVMTARMLFAVYEIAGEKWWSGDHHASREAIVEDVLTDLARLTIVLPAPS